MPYFPVSQQFRIHMTRPAGFRASNRTARCGLRGVGRVWLDLCFPTICGSRSPRSCRRLVRAQRADDLRSRTAPRSPASRAGAVGIPWEWLPAEMGCGCGMSCWRRLRDWQAAGVWARLHAVLLKRLHAAGEIDWGRASLDSASVPAKKGGLPRARTRRTGPNRARNATSSPTPAARRLA
jgi:transposase